MRRNPVEEGKGEGLAGFEYEWNVPMHLPNLDLRRRSLGWHVLLYYRPVVKAQWIHNGLPPRSLFLLALLSGALYVCMDEWSIRW